MIIRKISFELLLLAGFVGACKNEKEPSLPPGAAKIVDEDDSTEKVFGKIDKLGPSEEETGAIDGASKEAVPAADPTQPRYGFEKLNPVVTCTQNGVASSQGENLSLTCTALDESGQPFNPGAEPVQMRWNFSHATSPKLQPKINAAGSIDTPLNGATFSFPGPNNIALYYLANTGDYKFELVYSKDPGQVKTVLPNMISMVGEGCGAKDTLSFKVDSRNFKVIDQNVTVRVFAGGGARYYLMSGASLTTDGDKLTFLAPNGGKITDKGAGANAVIMKGGTYVAEGVPASIYADKGAKITAPKDKSFIFNSPLSLCP